MATIDQAFAIAVQHHQAGRLQAAEQIYRQILAIEPNHADAINLLGVIASQVGQHDAAIDYIQRAIGLNGNAAGFHNNLGEVYHSLRRLPEAVACYRRVVELTPGDATAQNNLGIALNEQGKLDEAAACYRRAIALKPDLADAHWNQSLLWLLTGDFQRGWAEYEWRWKANACQRRDFSQALWDGQPLEGRNILLHAEQGLGDAIQFVRYAPLVKQRGGVVVVECPRPLVPLLASCEGIARLVGRGDELPAFDVQAPLLSLPGIFRTSLRDMPATIPYLFADPGLVQRWRQELGHITGFKVGIAWQGNAKHRLDRDRSIPLACFEPLARYSGVQLLSLQKGAGVEQLPEVTKRFPVMELGSRLEDFMDTAAVLANLDLLVTCDTAVAHLAGALGVPVWVALPLVPDWRWRLDRSDSPWYPTMRLFRQESRGDWQGVFQKIAVAIGEQVASRASRPNA